MKVVCHALGLARSHIHTLLNRPSSWTDGRKGRTPIQDEQVLAEIKAQIAELPSYGYSRACALVNRQRVRAARPRINPKRVYRVMAMHALLLPRAPRSGSPVDHTREPSQWLPRTCAGAPTASRSSATLVKPSLRRSLKTAVIERSCRGGPGREKGLQANRCARC